MPVDDVPFSNLRELSINSIQQICTHARTPTHDALFSNLHLKENWENSIQRHCNIHLIYTGNNQTKQKLDSNRQDVITTSYCIIIAALDQSSGHLSRFQSSYTIIFSDEPPGSTCSRHPRREMIFRWECRGQVLPGRLVGKFGVLPIWEKQL